MFERTEFIVISSKTVFPKNEQQRTGNYTSFRKIHLSVQSR